MHINLPQNSNRKQSRDGRMSEMKRIKAEMEYVLLYISSKSRCMFYCFQWNWANFFFFLDKYDTLKVNIVKSEYEARL